VAVSLIVQTSSSVALAAKKSETLALVMKKVSG